MTHICVGKPITIGSDNGLSPDRRQAIIWTNARILLIWPLGSEILTGIQTFSFKEMHLKMSSAKWRPFFPGFNVLTNDDQDFWLHMISWDCQGLIWWYLLPRMTEVYWELAGIYKAVSRVRLFCLLYNQIKITHPLPTKDISTLILRK